MELSAETVDRRTIEWNENLARIRAEKCLGAMQLIVWNDGSVSFGGMVGSPAGHLALVQLGRVFCDNLELAFKADLARVNVEKQMEAQAAAAALAAEAAGATRN